MFILVFFFFQRIKTIYEHCGPCLCVMCVFAQIIVPMYTTSCIFTKEAELSDTHLNMF